MSLPKCFTRLTSHGSSLQSRKGKMSASADQGTTSELLAIAEQIESTLREHSRFDGLNGEETTIVEQFGGFDVMLYLCLSNPKCSKFVSERKLPSLKQLLQSRSNRDVNIDCIGGISNTSHKHDQNVTGSKATSHATKAVFSNLVQFYTHSMTLLADPYADIYHKKFNLSLQHTKFIVDKILFSKWFAMIWLSIITISYFVSQIYWLYHGHTALYIGIAAIAYVAVTIGGILYILSANVNICLLIIQTFDFWFKIYNLILAIISKLQ